MRAPHERGHVTGSGPASPAESQTRILPTLAGQLRRETARYAEGHSQALTWFSAFARPL